MRKYWGGYVPPPEPAGAPPQAAAAAAAGGGGGGASAARRDARALSAGVKEVAISARPPSAAVRNAVRGVLSSDKSAAVRAAVRLDPGRAGPAGVGGWRHFAKRKVVAAANIGDLPF
eukprot:TRINITY_DN8946_c0_g1_i1.p5 TRINITY_DN8946_c0_g1~~TRINITY_DN8946_c0_g1_i1.p5  ORF type:complete len:117 (+),score=19.51 TRINITY_DN8946_c0_g1_i1:146-496(+)